MIVLEESLIVARFQQQNLKRQFTSKFSYFLGKRVSKSKTLLALVQTTLGSADVTNITEISKICQQWKTNYKFYKSGNEVKVCSRMRHVYEASYSPLSNSRRGGQLPHFHFFSPTSIYYPL